MRMTELREKIPGLEAELNDLYDQKDAMESEPVRLAKKEEIGEQICAFEEDRDQVEEIMRENVIKPIRAKYFVDDDENEVNPKLVAAMEKAAGVSEDQFELAGKHQTSTPKVWSEYHNPAHTIAENLFRNELYTDPEYLKFQRLLNDFNNRTLKLNREYDAVDDDISELQSRIYKIRNELFDLRYELGKKENAAEQRKEKKSKNKEQLTEAGNILHAILMGDIELEVE